MFAWSVISVLGVVHLGLQISWLLIQDLLLICFFNMDMELSMGCIILFGGWGLIATMWFILESVKV